MSKLKYYMFRFFGNKKAAREILNMAASIVTSEDYMCPSIEKAIVKYYDITFYRISYKCLERYGYIRENYHSFIKGHFPILEDYLITDSCYWIRYYTKNRKECLESKKAFLKHLADET